MAFRVADPLHSGLWSRQGHSGSSWNRTGSRDRPAGRSSNGSRDKPGGSPGIDSRIGPEIDLGACRGTERCPPWLSDIPPGVSAKRYGQFLIILSEKNATSEYIDLGRGPQGANRPRRRSPRGQISPIYWRIGGTPCRHLRAVTKWSHDVGYYVGPPACFAAQTHRIPPGFRGLKAVRRSFEIDVLKSCGYLRK